MAEMSAHSSQSSADVLDRTSSTAIRDTAVQFLNDSAVVGTKPSVQHTRRARTHHVNVTVPTDTRRNTAGPQAQTKSRVTFQDAAKSDIEPSAISAVSTTNDIASAAVTDRQQNYNLFPSADRGMLFFLHVYDISNIF